MSGTHLVATFPFRVRGRARPRRDRGHCGTSDGCTPDAGCRRALVDEGIVRREADGSAYWRSE
ncbi:DUF2087 domain-containing protein [Sinomonas atrocyanea]|uniref:DUF2087 domain-containing protein n=1 Tax=Sinomonas atrocyanea TaxID=37927 RepID=UPI00358E7BFB